MPPLSPSTGAVISNLGSGGSRQSTAGGRFEEELVLVASSQARASDTDGETCVVATEDVLQTILGEDHVSLDGACRGSSGSGCGAATGRGAGGKGGLGVLHVGEGQGPDVTGGRDRDSSSIVAREAEDAVLGVDDRLLVVHVRHHVGVPVGHLGCR